MTLPSVDLNKQAVSRNRAENGFHLSFQRADESSNIRRGYFTMTVSGDEVFKVLIELSKDNEKVAQMVMDYMDKPINEVSSVDLCLAINEVHGHELAKTFAQ